MTLKTLLNHTKSDPCSLQKLVVKKGLQLLMDNPNKVIREYPMKINVKKDEGDVHKPKWNQ